MPTPPDSIFAGRSADVSKLLDQILTSIPDFVYIFDLEGRFIYINKALLDLWGMSLDEAVGKNFHELPYPEDLAEKLQQQIQQVIDTKGRVVDETSYTNPTGHVGVYQYIFSPVFSADGSVEAVAGATRDITEIRENEAKAKIAAKALAAERENLADVIKVTPSFVVVLRGSEHVVELANDHYLALIGRTDIVGKPIREVLPDVEGQGFFELLDDVYQSGELYMGNEVPVDFSLSGTRERHYVNFVYQPIRSPQGDITGIFVNGIDVTHSVKAREDLAASLELRDSQRRLFETILSNAPDLVYVFGLDHRFVYANQALLTMWGKTADEAFGKNCLELGYEPWHAEMHDREIEQVVATKAPIRGVVPFSGAFGRRMYDYIFVPVIGTSGEVEAVVGTTRDITERVEMEKKLAAQAAELAKTSQRKDDFLALLSHEIRNPLAPIASAVDLLKAMEGEDNPPSQRKAIDIIGRQVTNLRKIIDDLLEVSRVLSGKIHLQLAPGDLSKILENAVETARPHFVQRKHSLVVHPCKGSVLVNVDSTRIEEVFVNLLNNAAKYTPDGGQVDVFCEGEVSDGFTQIRIRDNGVGIDKDLLADVFDLFVQADRSLDRASGGLGVGLSLAKRLVELHNGSIAAVSPPEGALKGTEIAVRLPLASAPESCQEPSADKADADQDQGTRVLIVDDNVDLVEMLELSLRIRGYAVKTAHEGDFAYQVATEWHPEVIVLDIGLPGTDGFEVCKRLRQANLPGLKFIIAASGYGRETDVEKALAAGFDAHLTKPFSITDLEKLFKSS